MIYMTNERARAPYMPQGLLLERVTNLFAQYPDMTFMVRDVTSMIDFEIARDGIETPCHNESIRKIMNQLAADAEIGRRNTTSGDVLRYTARADGLLFYSATSPVPVYTQEMVDLYDEYPRPRTRTMPETPTLSAKPAPAPATPATTLDATTTQRVSILHGLVDQLVKDLTQAPMETQSLKDEIALLREDNETLKLRNSELRAQLNKIKTAMGL